MKQGRTLSELAQEIERQQTTKRDFITPSTSINMVSSGDGVALTLGGLTEQFGLTANAHDQLANHTGIPRAYYDKMLASSPLLLRENVNHWLQSSDKKRMVRTLDGNARAVLSDRYRQLDNYDLAQTVLPVVAETGMEIKSAEITEKHLYLKVVTPKLQGEVRKGDVVQAGIVIANSEVGAGRFEVEPMIFRLICLNGAIMADHYAGLKRFHVGRRFEENTNAYEVFRNETREADDRAFWMMVKDVVVAALDETRFKLMLSSMQGATEDKIQKNPIEVVEVTKKKFGLSEGENDGILLHLINGGDLTRYGLANAVTAYSQETTNYERATELERLGGTIIELNKTEWREIGMTS